MRFDWWTFALQTMNVLILLWILSRFLFRPAADIIKARQAEAGKLLSDAAAARHVRLAEAFGIDRAVCRLSCGCGHQGFLRKVYDALAGLSRHDDDTPRLDVAAGWGALGGFQPVAQLAFRQGRIEEGTCRNALLDGL